MIATALLVVTGCSTGGDDVSNDVLGVSVITSPLGRAHIAIVGSNVGVQLPDLTTDTTLGLSQDGTVVTRQHLDAGEEVTLTAAEDGLYELVAIDEGDSFETGEAQLGQSTAITRLTVVRIGE